MPIPARLAKWGIRLGVVQRLPRVQRLLGDGLAYLKYYNSRTLEAPNVELRAAQSILDAAQAPDVIDFSVGAPDLDPALYEAATKIGAAASGYPPLGGLPELRAALSRKLADRNSIVVDPRQELFVCNGASQALSLFLDAFIDPGERVAVFDPCYFMYRLAAQHRRARIHAIPTWLEEGFTRCHERDLRRGLRSARVVFLNNPVNPTGGVFSPELLEQIVWWCAKYDVLLFSDEVYERFVYNGEYVSPAALRQGGDRTVTANSFSKSHGMAAYRVGYVAGPRNLIQPMVVSYLASAPFVSIPAQRMALAALAEPVSRWNALRATFSQRRLHVRRRLAGMGLDPPLPGGAFFFWLCVRGFAASAHEFAAELLASERVLVMPGDTLAQKGGDFVRLSYAGEAKSVQTGLDRLAAFLMRSGRIASKQGVKRAA